MAADKHTIKIVDKDGNQSEVTLPGFALDMTQERLIKSVQALAKMNPKAAKAYEDLIDATRETVTSNKKSSTQQKKDTKALQDAVENASDKQVTALRQFQTNFADRVGKDMRDTFVTGGNILTAAIKTATVGLAAGAGLLYKTFMDTSDAFRQLAQAGLGGAGASGTEAQDAVRSLALLGMSASEAASLLTSFGQASTMLGKANFSKFVSGVASAGSFAADLGLTLEEAAEYAAEEIDIRQRALMGRVMLDGQQSQSVMDAIRQTQLLAGIMGKSMKDINQDKKEFVDNNANIASILNQMPEKYRAGFMEQMSTFGGASKQLGDNAGKLLQSIVNAAMLQTPIQDANLQQLASIGTGGSELIRLAEDLNKVLYNTNQFTAEQQQAVIRRFSQIISTFNAEEQQILSTLYGSGNAAAELFINSSVDISKFSKSVLASYNKTTQALDPLVTSSTRVQNALSQISGAFEAFKIQIMGGLAGPITAFTQAFTDTRTLTEKEIDNKIKAINEDKKLNDDEKKARIEDLTKAKAAANKAMAEDIKKINDNKELSAEEKQARIEKLYQEQRGRTIIQAFQEGLTGIADTFVKVFFGGKGLNAGAAEFSRILQEQLIPWVDETAKGIKTYLEALGGREGGDTFVGKLKLMATDLVTGAIKIIISATKAAIVELWQNPAVKGAIIDGIALLFGAALVKSALASAVTGLFKWVATGTVASAATSAGTAGAGGLLAATTGAFAASRATGSGRLAAGAQALKAIPGAGLAGRAITGGSLLTSGLMVGKDAFDVGRSLATGEQVKGGDVGGVIGGVLGGGLGFLAGGPVGAALGAAAGNWLGEKGGELFDSLFGRDKAEQAGTEVVEKTKEQLLQENGMMAMAMDPVHIKAVGTALKDFNNVSVANISKGLETFNPKLQEMFEVIQAVKAVFVDVVNKRLEHLLNNITGLNLEGLKLPVTIDYLNKLASTITAMPIETIQKLAVAMSSLTVALRDFTSLTTSNIFSRGMDFFTQKQDDTAKIAKSINDFADDIDSEKVLKAAEAILAFNAGVAGYAAVPSEPKRSSAAGDKATAEQVNSTAKVGYNNPYEKLKGIEAELVSLNEKFSRDGVVTKALDNLRGIKSNTGKPDELKTGQ